MIIESSPVQYCTRLMAKIISYRNTMNTKNLISIWQKYNEYWKCDTYMAKKNMFYRNTMNTPITMKRNNNIPNRIGKS
jgi:hypothetical protein